MPLIIVSFWKLCIQLALLSASVNAISVEASICTDDKFPDRGNSASALLQHVSWKRQIETIPAEETSIIKKWRSSIICVGVASQNQSCKIRNAYIELPSGKIVLMLKQNDEVPDIGLKAIGVPGQGGVEVLIKRHSTDQELIDAASSLNPSRVDGLALMLCFMWAQNWAHGMFDGFWPGYVALAKFGKHTEPFHVLQKDGSFRGCSPPENESSSMQCSERHTFGRFAHNNATWQTEWIEMPEQARGWMSMDELIVGSESSGEYTSVSGLPGTMASLEPLPNLPAGTDLVEAFANRMYRTHGIPEMVSKKSSLEGVAGRKLRVLITDNERYHPEDIRSMKEYSEGGESLSFVLDTDSTDSFASAKLQAVDLLNEQSDIEAHYVDWREYFPLSGQLPIIRSADIHMSSTGTAQFFGLFLQDGAVNINLGNMVNRTPFVFPSWGEDGLAASNPRIRAIYRNISRLSSGFLTSGEIVDLVNEAASMIRSGFPIPLSKLEENLSPFGRIMYSLTSADKPSLHGVRGYTNHSGYKCHCTGLSNQMDTAPLVLGLINASRCPGVNMDLLREIRNAQLGPEFKPFIV